MSTRIKNENIETKTKGTQELTNWQKIDQMEADIERQLPKKKRKGGMKFRKIFGDTAGQVFQRFVLPSLLELQFQRFLQIRLQQQPMISFVA